MPNSDKKRSRMPLLVITPLIVTALSASVLLAAMIKPYNKAKVYLNLAFMDNMKTDPNEDELGLVIVDNDIQKEYGGKTSETGTVERADFGEMFAVINCDRFETEVPVYWGSSSELYEHGACQASNSVMPGEQGNTVISAHEDTYFADLSKLETGDTVTLNTNYGEFEYKVKETISFKKTNKKYVVPSNDTRLTLYTCKKDVLGASDERIGVICEPLKTSFYVSEGGAD